MTKIETVSNEFEKHKSEPNGLRQISTINALLEANVFADSLSALAFLKECMLDGEDFNEPFEKKIINRWIAMSDEQRAGYQGDMSLFASYTKGVLDGTVTPR